MYCPRTSFTSPKIFINFFKSEFHISAISEARSIKTNRKNERNFMPHGSPFKNATDDMEHFDENEKDINYMAKDLAFDEFEEEAKKWKRKVDFKIISKKFFSTPPLPSMLTYNEKMCIKHLHKEDPIQWDVDTLSESFPATPEAIKKILRSNWRASPEKIIKMDTVVQKNWQLLEENKLDAPPEVIEHLKKFTSRRQALLEQLNSENIYLPAPKETVSWNGGEMTGILKSYEKKLKKLQRKHEKECKKQLVSDGFNSKSLEEEAHQDQCSSIDLLHKNIEKVVEKPHIRQKETFVMGQILRHFNEPVTYDKLEADILAKAATEKLSLSEKALLESRYDKVRTESKEKGNESMKMDGINSQEKRIEQKTKMTSQKQQAKALYSTETSVIINSPSEESDSERQASNEITGYQNKYSYENQNTAFNFGMPPIGDTEFGSELEVGRMLQNIKFRSEPSNKKHENTNNAVKKSVVNFNRLVKEDPERLDKDTMYFEKIANDLKDTGFWNSKQSKNEKFLTPKSIDKVTRPDTFETDNYPQRIKIPHHQRGSGLTFKVRDCYYDDDGEFLYRVPGMAE